MTTASGVECSSSTHHHRVVVHFVPPSPGQLQIVPDSTATWRLSKQCSGIPARSKHSAIQPCFYFPVRLRDTMSICPRVISACWAKRPPAHPGSAKTAPATNHEPPRNAQTTITSLRSSGWIIEICPRGWGGSFFSSDQIAARGGVLCRVA